MANPTYIIMMHSRCAVGHRLRRWISRFKFCPSIVSIFCSVNIFMSILSEHFNVCCFSARTWVLVRAINQLLCLSALKSVSWSDFKLSFPPISRKNVSVSFSNLVDLNTFQFFSVFFSKKRRLELFFVEKKEILKFENLVAGCQTFPLLRKSFKALRSSPPFFVQIERMGPGLEPRPPVT